MGLSRLLGASFIALGLLLGVTVLYSTSRSSSWTVVSVHLPKTGVPVARLPEPSNSPRGAFRLVTRLARGYETTTQVTVLGVDGRSYILPSGTPVPGSCGLRLVPLLVAFDVLLAVGVVGLAGRGLPRKASRAVGIVLLLIWMSALVGLFAIPCMPDVRAESTAVLRIERARPVSEGQYIVVDGLLLGRWAMLADRAMRWLSVSTGLLIAAMLVLSGLRLARKSPETPQHIVREGRVAKPYRPAKTSYPG